jgi:hypothetical protein
MIDPEFEYTVILVFPGFGSERECAETIVEAALDWLNNNKEEPGFRFAPSVGAHLEIVPSVEEARTVIEADESVAMVILHDLDNRERKRFIRDCVSRGITACYTVDEPRKSRSDRGGFEVVIRPGRKTEAPTHRVGADTLTAPIEDEAEIQDRVSQLIAVMALGVMQHHWEKSPPSW